MSTEYLVLIGTVLAGISGVPGLVLGRRSGLGERLAVLLLSAGCGCGLAGVVSYFAGGAGEELAAPAPLPGAEFLLAVDALSAFFLAPIFLLPLLGSIYGLAYWSQAEHPDSGRRVRLFYGLLTAGMALVVAAHSGILFLFGWELMAVAAFFLVTAEDDPEAQRAGFLYLAASHFATLCLFGVFGLLAAASGSFELNPLRSLEPGPATAIFLLAVLGFGTKAGLMPLHFWLPGAHASAPSHVSAVMSGVFIKVGVYGLVRTCSLLPLPPVWWGALLLVLGTVSAVLGVAFALGQHDLKRLLAYHSIENIGLIILGLGLALLGRSLGHDDWVVLGLGGALLHVWNHALFKGLLFLAAGSVVHATHTRALDRLGGLARIMPATANLFLVGAVAICALPPLNGFVSELLLYLGLFRTLNAGPGPAWSSAAFAAPALALVGALAAACFAKVFAVVFLGTPRSEAAQHAHEADRLMLGPMAVLAGICFTIGLAPALFVPVLQDAIDAWRAGGSTTAALTQLAPFGWLSVTGAILVVGLVAGYFILRRCIARGGVATGPTWGCGYIAPTPRMQYTASSFAQMLVGLFGWALRPHVYAPHIEEPFPRQAALETHVGDPVLEETLLPAAARFARFSSWMSFLQRGNVQAYLLYLFAILIVLLLWR